MNKKPEIDELHYVATIREFRVQCIERMDKRLADEEVIVCRFGGRIEYMMLFYLILKDRFSFEQHDLVYDTINCELWIRPRKQPDYSNQR
jgi:hypothetical protein